MIKQDNVTFELPADQAEKIDREAAKSVKLSVEVIEVDGGKLAVSTGLRSGVGVYIAFNAPFAGDC